MCQSCESVFVSEQLPDGTIKPIGVSADCTCGDGTFRRVSPSGGPEPSDDGAANQSNDSDTGLVRPPSD